MATNTNDDTQVLLLAAHSSCGYAYWVYSISTARQLPAFKMALHVPDNGIEQSDARYWNEEGQQMQGRTGLGASLIKRLSYETS